MDHNQGNMPQITGAPISDDALWQQLQQGEKSALQELFHRYYDSLVRFATPILKDQDLARDLVQDLFYDIWVKKEKIQISSSLKAYLYMACRNTALNRLKREARMQWTDDEGELENLHGSTDGTFDRMREKDLQSRLSHALDQLPPKCRQVFELSRFDHMTNKEVADTLEISVKTVENQMTKALQVLRTHLLPHLKVWLGLLFSSLFFS